MDFWKMSFWRLFLSGGPIMWPILLCSIFALGISLEKLFYLNRINAQAQGLLSKILDKVKRHEIKDALQICDSAKTPLADILKSGILKYDRPRPQIIEAIQDASLYEIPKIERNLPILSTICHIAPLLGFLGTVIGMVSCFQILQAKAADFRSFTFLDVSSGIWQALIATVAGLVVAIPAYIAYNYLVSRVSHFILEMEKAGTELVNFLTE